MLRKFGILAFLLGIPVQAESVHGSAHGGQALVALPYATVTVLVDNVAGGEDILGEWGAAFLINTGQHQILFDTGWGKVLMGNSQALGVDLARTDAIVISHGHLDHTGGLDTALDVCRSSDLFIHPAVFETKYYKGNSGVGTFNFVFTRQQLFRQVRNLVETKGPTIICEGVMVTGQIPRVNDFEDTGLRGYVFLDSSLTIEDQMQEDQAMFFRVPEGIVILLGCAHAGVVNTMDYVCTLTGEKSIYAIIGGAHLLGVSPLRMQKTIEALRKYDVERIMLSHCTGLRAYADLVVAFPERCRWPASGTTIKFGSR